MKEEVVRPLPKAELASIMGVPASELDERSEFSLALADLEHEGKIIANRSGLYGIPARMNLVVGRLSVSPKGFGFIIPDDRLTEDETDVFVLGGNMLSAMHGDRVVARVSPSEIPNRSREGEVLRILERANTQIVGTFERSQRFGFVTPDSAKLNDDIFVEKKYFAGAKTGDKVIVEILKWKEKGRSAEGRIIELLGKNGDPGIDVLSIMRQNNLSTEFPPPVAEEASRIESIPNPAEYEGRRDRRGYPIVTIDGEDTKDIDDGVYAYQKENGDYFLGVYIADVSQYVREGTPLDTEAESRGTSIYLVDRVIPMLPKELSNGICSLNEGVDRLAMACEMVIDRNSGEVVSYEIIPTVIHVYRRLSYNLVNKILAKEEPYYSDNEDIQPLMTVLDSLRRTLKSKRERRGSIEFELAEVKVKLDDKGRSVDLIKRIGSLGESIIEECMLAANETVARHMELKEEPFIYRVHEEPSGEKIERLTKLLHVLGMNLPANPDGKVKPMDIQRVLNKVKGEPEERIVSAVALRSMQQARYSTQSLGHFGLAARYYTHFTSPIRRYPDLIVHRLLSETFATGHIAPKRREILAGRLPLIAEHSSARERIAIEVERETTDMKKVEYMAQFIGESYKGVISGVTQFGIFVELDNGVEGLVHVSTMVNDYYSFVESSYAMIGERTNARYRLGDVVEVVLIRANIETRTLDFVLKDNGVYDLSKTNDKPANEKETAGAGEKSTSAKNKRRSKTRKNKGKNHNDKKAAAIVEVSSEERPLKKSARPAKKKERPHAAVAKPSGEAKPAKKKVAAKKSPVKSLRDKKLSHHISATVIPLAGIANGGYGNVWQEPPKLERKPAKRSKRPLNKARKDEAAKPIKSRTAKPKPQLKRKTGGGTGRAK